MEIEKLNAILAAHLKWLHNDGGERADLSDADLSRAYLSGAYLSDAYLSRADLSGANLSGADLSGAYLSGAYLPGANLSRANLSDAYLSGANLSRADLSGANLDYSAWPLCCNSTKAKVDEKIFVQLLYHALKIMPEKSPVKKMVSKKLKNYINKTFHHSECGKL